MHTCTHPHLNWIHTNTYTHVLYIVYVYNCTHYNDFQWNYNHNAAIFMHENDFENYVCAMVAICRGRSMLNYTSDFRLSTVTSSWSPPAASMQENSTFICQNTVIRNKCILRDIQVKLAVRRTRWLNVFIQQMIRTKSWTDTFNCDIQTWDYEMEESSIKSCQHNHVECIILNFSVELHGVPFTYRNWWKFRNCRNCTQQRALVARMKWCCCIKSYLFHQNGTSAVSSYK